MAPILKAICVSHRFKAVHALKNVSLDFFAGEIHAVLGENGAGKSTLMSVLSGFLKPDAGSIVLNGEIAPIGKAHLMKKLGVQLVHQHFMFVPSFTIKENFALANLNDLRGRLDVDFESKKAILEGQRLGWKINGDLVAGDLSVGVQQRIEILKALAAKSDVLILDEPTAVLSEEEVEGLFSVLRALKTEGKAVILIAHKLAEIMSVADRVTVLRRGEVVKSALITETSKPELLYAMVGDIVSQTKMAPVQKGEVLASVKDIVVYGDRGERAVNELSLEVRSGEILGIGGVDGNGQVELAEALALVRKVESGLVSVPERLAYIPQDRQSDGLALDMSIYENTLMGQLNNKRFYWGPFLIWPRIRKETAKLIKNYDVKIGSFEDPIRTLSGGNQQKIVVARSLEMDPDLIIAVNPTRGLDAKATAFVWETLKSASSSGVGIVLLSTDRDEISAVADRTSYLSRGKLTEKFLEDN